MSESNLDPDVAVLDATASLGDVPEQQKNLLLGPLEALDGGKGCERARRGYQEGCREYADACAKPPRTLNPESNSYADAEQDPDQSHTRSRKAEATTCPLGFGPASEITHEISSGSEEHR